MPATRRERKRRAAAILALLAALLPVIPGSGLALPGGGGQSTGVPPCPSLGENPGFPGGRMGLGVIRPPGVKVP